MAKWGEEIEEYHPFETDLKRIKDLMGNLRRISKVIRSSGNLIFWTTYSSSSPICKWVLHLSFDSTPINAFEIDLQPCHASSNFSHPFLPRPLKHFLSLYLHLQLACPVASFSRAISNIIHKVGFNEVLGIFYFQLAGKNRENYNFSVSQPNNPLIT